MASPTRELAYLKHHEELKDEADRDAFAERVAGDVVGLVNAERARQGLPLLPEE